MARSGDEVSTVTQLRRVRLIPGLYTARDPTQLRHGTDLIATTELQTTDRCQTKNQNEHKQS